MHTAQVAILALLPVYAVFQFAWKRRARRARPATGLTQEQVIALFAVYLAENFYVDRNGEAFWPRSAFTPDFQTWLREKS